MSFKFAVARLLEDDSEWRFKTHIKENVTVYGKEAVEDAWLVVDWHLDFDVRGYGVKEMLFVIDTVHGGGRIETYDRESGAIGERELVIYWSASETEAPVPDPADIKASAMHLAGVRWKVSATRGRRAEEHASLTVVPYEAEIDMKRHTINVLF